MSKTRVNAYDAFSKNKERQEKEREEREIIEAIEVRELKRSLVITAIFFGIVAIVSFI